MFICDCLVGYEDVFKVVGFSIDDLLLCVGDFMLLLGYWVVIMLFDLFKCLIVIFCENDEMVMGVMCKVCEVGLFIFEDIFIVGFDNIVFLVYVELLLIIIV